MKISVGIKEVYGRTTVYPLCAKARLFAKIAGTKTLTIATLKDIQRLGYDVDVIGLNGIIEPLAA